MKAELLLRKMAEDSFIELVVWSVPEAKRGSRHSFKYRLAHVVSGVCVLRFDNEAGKGDHVHRSGVESAYNFTTIDNLLSDFIAEVRNWRSI